jgi:hypothetical protein
VNQVKGFSELTGDIIDIGPPTQDADAILELGSMAATGHDNLIVFTEKPVPLQEWKDEA